jgi:hypothetical protein
MQSWPKHPLNYEISTWVWLEEPSRIEQYPLTLASVPDAEWDLEWGFHFLELR